MKESNESSLVWVPETLRETEGFYESLRQPSSLNQTKTVNSRLGNDKNSRSHNFRTKDLIYSLRVSSIKIPRWCPTVVAKLPVQNGEIGWDLVGN